MNFANLPIYILFFAVVYLVSIYGLLLVAQMLKPENNSISSNSQENNNPIEIP